MNTLRESMEQYVQLRRNLGAKLRGVDSSLRSFVAFAERQNASFITTDLALRWAQRHTDFSCSVASCGNAKDYRTAAKRLNLIPDKSNSAVPVHPLVTPFSIDICD